MRQGREDTVHNNTAEVVVVVVVAAEHEKIEALNCSNWEDNCDGNSHYDRPYMSGRYCHLKEEVQKLMGA